MTHPAHPARTVRPIAAALCLPLIIAACRQGPPPVAPTPTARAEQPSTARPAQDSGTDATSTEPSRAPSYSVQPVDPPLPALGEGAITAQNAVQVVEVEALPGPGDWLMGVAFHPAKNLVALGTAEHGTRLIDLDTGFEVTHLGGGQNGVVLFTPVGERVVTGGYNNLLIYDLADESLMVLEGHSDIVTSAAVSPDGALLVSGSAGTVNRGYSVRLWDAAAAAELLVIPVDDGVHAVAISPDHRRLAYSGPDDTVVLWDAIAGEELAVLAGHTGRVTALAFNPDGSLLASGSEDGGLILWDADSGDQRAALEGHTARVQGLAFGGDGSVLASVSRDGSLKLWDVGSGAALASLEPAVEEGASDWLMGIALSPDGTRFATAGADGLLRLWGIAR